MSVNRFFASVVVIGAMCIAGSTQDTLAVTGPTSPQQQQFFIGRLVSDAKIEPQINMYAVFQSLGIPVSFVGESFTFDYQVAGPNLYHLVQSASPSNIVVQDTYFQLGTDATTRLINGYAKYTVRATDSNTLTTEYAVEDSGIKFNTSFNFGKLSTVQTSPTDQLLDKEAIKGFNPFSRFNQIRWCNLR